LKAALNQRNAEIEATKRQIREQLVKEAMEEVTLLREEGSIQAAEELEEYLIEKGLTVPSR
jgi:hypothetical protein